MWQAGPEDRDWGPVIGSSQVASKTKKENSLGIASTVVGSFGARYIRRSAGLAHRAFAALLAASLQ